MGNTSVLPFFVDPTMKKTRSVFVLLVALLLGLTQSYANLVRQETDISFTAPPTFGAVPSPIFADPAAESALATALEALQAGRFHEARRLAQAFLTIEPRSAPALEIIGAALALEGDLDGGRKSLEKALSSSAMQWTALVKLGDLDLAEGKLSEAEARYRQAAKQQPQDLQLQQRLGLIEFYARRFDKARLHFEKGVTGLDKDVVGVRPNLAWIYNQQGEFRRSLNLFDGVPLDKVKDAEAYIAVSTALAGLGRANDALSLLERARKELPTHAGLWQLSGRIARHTGDRDLSLRAMTEAVRLKPKSHIAAMELALAEISNGKTEAGLARAEAAAKADAKNAVLALGLSQAYSLSGATEKAIALYRQLVKNPATERVATLELARLMTGAGKFSEAEALLAGAQRKSPRDPAPLQLLGSVQATQGKYPAAIISFNKALAIEAQQPQVLRLLTVAQASAGLPREALGTAEKLVGLLPDNPHAILLLGLQQEANGQAEAAQKSYGTVLSKDGTSLVARNNLALLLLKNGNSAEANKHAELLYKTAPEKAEVLDTVGWIYLRTGHPSEAHRVLEQATKLNAGPNVWYHLAIFWSEQGDKAKAAEFARKALSLGGNFKYVKEAKLLAAASP